jgi:exodeoxyribonuclease V gamma subunit
MLRVVESNRFEELGQALAGALADVADPFAPPLVAVPGRVVGRWLQYAIAREAGVAAGYRPAFLEILLGEVLTSDDAGLRALDKPGLEAVVASALADDALLDQPAMLEPRSYLDADGVDGRGPRRVQLAAQLADRLWEYALTRPDWLDAWERGDDDVDDLDPGLALWQARLWRAVLERLDATPADDGRRLVVTPRLAIARARLRQAAPAGPPIFVVGFSFLARAYLDALAYLAERREIVVLALSPCAAYWGDVARPQRRSALASRAAALTPGEPPALVRWGSAGRDYLASLTDLSQGDIDERFDDRFDHRVEHRVGDRAAAPASALELWRRDNLVRAESPRGTAVEAGLEVLAAPSPARELEIVAERIRALLDGDPSLAANDVAVLLPPGATELYLGQIAAVFGAAELPHHLVDVTAIGHGHVAEAAQLLLELPLGSFRRPELLGLMTHPAVIVRHSHVDPTDWVRWADQVAVIHGADAGDHASTYLDGEDAFHWDQGLKRLALGGFMAGAATTGFGGGPAADIVWKVHEKVYLPEEVASDELPSAATFALLARSLIADARWLRTQRRSLTGWAEIFDALVAAYLGGTGASADDEIRRVRAILGELAELDLDGRLLDLREAVALARRRLERVSGDRGEPLAHGVHVARLVPHRPVPFRAVFCLGLGEDGFPSAARPSPLDLRRGRRPGDVSPRERDRYAFFEAVLAARDHLVLSYVAREPVSGEPRGPSTVIHQLAEMLAPYLGWTADRALDQLTVHHPLHRFDARYWTAPAAAGDALPPPRNPQAAREHHAATVRGLVERAAARAGRSVPAGRPLRRALSSAPHLGQVAKALGLGLGADLPAASDDAPVVVRLGALRKFLESAPQGWAQAVLRIGQDDDDGETIDVDEEPLELDALHRAIVLRDAFGRYLTGAPRAAALDGAWARLRRGGHAPVGVFGEVLRATCEERLNGWASELEGRGGKVGDFRVIAFGRATSPDAIVVPPIAIDVELGGRVRKVEVVGQTEPIGAAQVGALILAMGKVGDRHKLRAAFDHLALSAAGLLEVGAYRHLILSGDKPHAAEHDRWSPADARAHLALLLHDLFASGHGYLLSLDMAIAALDGEAVKVETARDGRPGSIGFGPLLPRDDFGPIAEAAALAERRLAPLWRRMRDL